MEKLLVTDENIGDLVYPADAGVSYELMPGCVRTMKRATIGLDRKYTEELSKENPRQADYEADDYWVNLRLKVVEMITEGDAIPADAKDDIDVQVMNRVLADFLRLRSFSLPTQKASSV
jgi:hypothetical protein